MASTSERKYDVVVVGGGPVGENAAGRVVAGGLSAVLVETERVGGECSYWACIPSKTLLRSGSALAAARAVPGAKEAVTGRLDAREVLRRRDSFVSNWDDSGQVDWATGAGVDILRGHARLAGQRSVEVTAPDGDRIRLVAGSAVVVCAGSVPSTPPITGLDAVDIWGSREATSAEEVPRSLAVLGGGPVGCELAQAWARLGSEVTVIDGAERLLPSMEDFAGDLVAKSFERDGIHLRRSAAVTKVSTVDDKVSVSFRKGEPVTAQHLLVATGRRPNTGDLGLETVGLNPGEPLEVDDYGQVRGVEAGWLYAAGDVTDQPPLTHQGKYAARVVADVIVARNAGRDVIDAPPWSRFVATANEHAVPQVVFTDPEVAAVGKTAASAEAAGYRVSVVDHELSVAGSALHADGYQGHARMVVDEDRGVLVGVTFVGQDVAELLHSATVAVAAEVPLERLWHAVPAFPTISEIWLRLLEEYGL